MSLSVENSVTMKCLNNITLGIIIVIATLPLVIYMVMNYKDQQLNSSSMTLKPICKMSRILQKHHLLTDGEDPYYQPQDNCRLHHYSEEDVATCLDRLSTHPSIVRIAFVGDSVNRYQFQSFIRVNIFSVFNSFLLLNTI